MGFHYISCNCHLQYSNFCPQKVLYGQVLPNLVDWCLSVETMFLALPAMLALIDYVTLHDYKTVILPKFRIILNAPRPMQVTSTKCL